MWYTSTFVVIFVYLYVYLVQFIRGAEIRSSHYPLRSRLGVPPPLVQSPPPLTWSPPSAGSVPMLSPPPAPPSAVFSDYLNPGGLASSGHQQMAVSSSMSVGAVGAVPHPPENPFKPLDFSYHNYDDMTAWLKAFSTSHPDLTALYSIGKSVQGE